MPCQDLSEHESKVIAIKDLCNKLDLARALNKKIACCSGVFDILHVGHIKHLKQAKSMSDILIVIVTGDQFVNKGPSRPIFTGHLRAEAIAALSDVDYIVIGDALNSSEMLKTIAPDFYVKGTSCQKDLGTGSKLDIECSAVKKLGGKIIFTDEEVRSSSSIINSSYLSNISEDLKNFIVEFKKQFSVDDIKSYFEQIKNLKVLVLGEAIIDEYSYCEAIGKAGKEPVLVARSINTEQFLGGSLAIANNLASFNNSVSILSFLGDIKSNRELIFDGLSEKINPKLLTYKNRPTITKQRFVESYLLQKLFELYIIDDSPLHSGEEDEFISELNSCIDEFDIIIVADYGHGLMTDKVIELLGNKAKFLAVNTQCNAGNTGMHTISRYPKANYISISQRELTLELRRRTGEVEDMIQEVLKRVKCERISITRGRYGIVSYWEDDGFIFAPGLTDHVVDRIGSGDAVLAVTSLLAAVKAPSMILAFIGNIVGAHAVKTMGHRTSLNFEEVIKDIEALLK